MKNKRRKKQKLLRYARKKMVYFGYAPKHYCFGVLAFFSWFLLENIIVLPKTRCFIYLNFSRLNIGSLILLSFWIWSMNLFFSNNFNLFSQYFFQYSSWLHLKWSLNLTFFSKSILVFLIFNYIANFIPFLFNSSPFYLWLHFSSPFILLHFLV